MAQTGSKWQPALVRRFCQVVALIAATGSTTGLFAANPDVDEEVNRFGLFNSCSPIGLVIELLDGEKGGLRELAVQRAVESRLRSARIFDATWTSGSPSEAYLYILISFSDSAFAVDLALYKRVYDFESLLSNYASTWRSVRATGTHGRNPTHVLSGVSQLTDQFLFEYLRVNEESCRAQE